MSEQRMLDRLGLDADERATWLDFLRIDDTDRRRLAEIAPFLESIAGEMVDRFYDHILSYPQTSSLLQDPRLVARLKQAQHDHFVSLARGAHDEDYFAARLRVGMAHARIRLDPHWYMGGYLVQMDFIQSKLFDAYGTEPGKIEGYLRSLWKVIMLDIALATDAYIYGGFVERSLADAHAREADRARHALLEKEKEEMQRERLLSMIVHDIRSPVTAMIATARVGLRRYKDGDAPPGKQFRLVEESGNNVLSIIDDMLELSRVPQGELRTDPKPFDLAGVLYECVEQLMPFAQQSGHTVFTDCAESLPVDGLDPVLVRRIVSNLLMNALRHTPSGTAVTVGCARNDDRCEIRVADDGPGIARHIRETLFEQPTKRGQGAYADSGLGLPFCALASQSLGGSIRFEETRSRGSCFVVDLPAR